MVLVILFASCDWLVQESCETLVCQSKPKLSCLTPVLDSYSFTTVGVGQGIQVIGNKIYLYGAGDTGGIVQELDLNLNPTGWVGRLTYFGKEIIPHPTGIATRDGQPTFIGGTISRIGSSLYEVDWNLFQQDKNLDRALLRTIKDSGAQDGTHPEYVIFRGALFVATSDSGSDEDAEVRLMDPEKLAAADDTLEPNVIRFRIPAGPNIQDLFWDESASRLVLVQNAAGAAGWRLSSLNLETAVVTKSNCLDMGSELEGFAVLPDGREIFLDSSLNENFYVSPSATGAL